MSVGIHSLLIKTYVNCVKFLNEKYLLASAGNILQAYNLNTSELLVEQIIFKSQRIHEIVEKKSKVLLFGGFQVAFVDISVDSNQFSFNLICDWTTEQWVQDVSFLTNNKCAVLGSSNVLYFYKLDSGDVSLEKKFQCKERSVLYCGKILGTSWSDAIVLCGTVFSQITIWSPSLNDNEIVHRLIGHQGVIFSVTYHKENQTICSTSDDRSLKIWKVQMEASENIVEKWKYAKITLLTSIFGHTARVWKNLQLNNDRILSIGEDGQLKVWNGDTCVQSWSSHQNGNIWSMDYNETSQLIVTGGGDAGIQLWPLSSVENLHDPLQLKVELATEDFPRQVLMARNKKLLIYTNNGIILSCGTNFNKNVLEDARFKSFCILCISKCKEYYSIASITGDIIIFYESSDQVVCELHLGCGKIFSLHWLAHHHFVICKTQGLLTLFQLLPESKCVLKIHNFVLPPCKERWLTAAILADNLFICGDRDGSIHVYSCETQCLLKTHHKIHSRLGVSCINYNIDRKTLLSIGRDGFLRHWEIKKSDTNWNNIEANDESWNQAITYDSNEKWSRNDNSLDVKEYRIEKDLKSSKFSDFLVKNNHKDISCAPNLHQVSADKLPLEWPAHIYTSNDGDIYILGFHEVHFVMWSIREQKILLKLKCGGGHRSWDYFLQGSHLYLSFIKHKRVYHVDVNLFQITRPAIVQPFHRDEINALVCVKMKEEELIISGGEDNTLRISLLCDKSDHSSHSTADILKTKLAHTLGTTSQNNNDPMALDKQTQKSSQSGDAKKKSSLCSLDTHLIMRSHISSIRALNYVHLNEDVYLVSAGGRAQLKIWKLSSSIKKRPSEVQNFSSKSSANPNSSSLQNQSPSPITNHVHNKVHKSGVSIQYQCKELFSHMLNGADRKEKSWKLVKPRINAETRYMDITLYTDTGNLFIATACSDGYVRVFSYHLETNKFEILQELGHHGQCVLKVHFAKFGFWLILCSLSTSGDLAIWDFRKLISITQTSSVEEKILSDQIKDPSISHRKNSTVESSMNDFYPKTVYNLHDGGTNSFDSRSVGADLLLISGGDDCSLVLTQLSPELTQTQYSRTLQAHNSQITGVKFLNNTRLVTSSVDQRIVVWTWRETSGELIRLAQLDSCIPDVHGLDIINEDRVCVFGCGVHIVEVMDKKNEDKRK